MPEYRKMEAAGLPVKFLSSADYDKYLENEEARQRAAEGSKRDEVAPRPALHKLQ